jgi:ribosome-binding factor A
MPKDYPRAERVEQLAREVLGEAIHDLKDPRIGFVTITKVKMSPDLRMAKVYVSVLGSENERTSSMEAVHHAAQHLRHVLGQEVRLRHLPQLDFIEDDTATHGERIESLLREIGVAKPPKVEKLADPADSEEQE